MPWPQQERPIKVSLRYDEHTGKWIFYVRGLYAVEVFAGKFNQDTNETEVEIRAEFDGNQYHPTVTLHKG